jgi:glycosyltransferase involved in cell wall biosynthesis
MSKAMITAIINAHTEGMLALPTLQSVSAASAAAQDSGIEVETICVLDKADSLTETIVKTWATKARNRHPLIVEYGDLGLSRNAGVAAASGDFIAFIDADDLWESNWLKAAYEAARRDKRDVVWHPECNVYFGTVPHIFIHEDMELADFDYTKLCFANCWTALCFAKRELLLKVPYKMTDLKKQLGYEDWAWNLETIAAGAIHKVVPNTSHAIRMKGSSLVKDTTIAMCMPHPTDLYRNILKERTSKERASA